MSTAPLLVIQHEDTCPPSWFADWLAAEGLLLDVVRGHRGDPIPDDLSAHSGLLVLGGAMGANDDASYGWLTATKSLLATAVAAGSPVLGICLGHQLMAAALGGEVVVNPLGPSSGLTPLGLTDAGRADPLLGAAVDGSPLVQWNGDIVALLPDSAVELATAPDGTVQAVRFGERAWGVQYHPEASPAVFRSWTVDRPSTQQFRADGVDVFAVAAVIDAAEPALRAAGEPLARRFAQIVHEGAEATGAV